VTGTKGKGTTSTLIYEMLKKEGFDAYLGGNIGIPPLSFLSELKGDSKVVLELSSFQLIDLEQSPHIGVILMTTSEHLDYHSDVYEYIEAKRNIFKFQDYKDFAIVNRDYPASNESDIYSNGKVYRVSREQDVDQGCFVKNDGIVLKMDGNENEILATRDLALRGKHNWENVCAATVAALCAGCSMKSIIPVLKSFKGLEYRIEHVATTRGVAYYDDSFSTTPETAIAEIEAFDEPKILILGGSSKNSNFSELGQIISESESIKAIIGIGVEWGRIKQEIKGLNPSIAIIEDCQTMEEIIQQCVEIGEIGDVVLLSPACASFDMFKSYKDRGDQFKEEVKKLIN
jgi:UDP-N-acetylmuramoylalanine--D-glutamate ligase